MNFICTGCILTAFVEIYVHRELFKTIKIAYSEIFNIIDSQLDISTEA